MKIPTKQTAATATSFFAAALLALCASAAWAQSIDGYQKEVRIWSSRVTALYNVWGDTPDETGYPNLIGAFGYWQGIPFSTNGVGSISDNTIEWNGTTHTVNVLAVNQTGTLVNRLHSWRSHQIRLSTSPAISTQAGASDLKLYIDSRALAEDGRLRSLSLTQQLWNVEPAEYVGVFLPRRRPTTR